MKVGSIAPWFGGKRTLAPAIVAQLGKHTQYFEPFCGSMAVLLAKPRSQKETVNDLHGDLINLARVIQNENAAPVLYERLERTIMSEGVLRSAQAVLEDESGRETVDDEAIEYPGAVSPLMIERAYWYFVASWMGRNGTAGTTRLDYQIAVRWTKNGGSPTVRWFNAVESLPAWHIRLRNVVIVRRDAFKIVDRFEDVRETSIYADPPYAYETRSSYDNKAGGKGWYLHEFEHQSDLLGSDDHQRLATALRAYQHARIVVSAYDCPRYRELYDGWTFIDHRRRKHLHVQNGLGGDEKEAPEVLIVNGPERKQ